MSEKPIELTEEADALLTKINDENTFFLSRIVTRKGSQDSDYREVSPQNSLEENNNWRSVEH
jgi:hypothetical protein